MHIAIAIWALLAALKWADWKRWNEFLPTIYFMVSMNLLYQYIAHSRYHLWTFEQNLPNELVTDTLYGFLVFPCTVMLFLSNYPNEKGSIIFHYLKWILIYCTLEWIGKEYGFMSYSHGWSLKWSVFFNCIMFPMLRLHHVKPLWALGISPLIIFILLTLFY
ncbi:CBO0543 family protein [Paenibacillus harenae]|uniref:CBO0543 family protein n=1 Tax=Paenibacillus harenae TaxID=306543 RepID=UPI000491AECD